MMKRILVPIDGSAHAFKALGFASEVAAKFGAEMLLLHVVSSRELPETVRQFAQAEHIEGPPEYVYEKVIAENILQKAKEQAREQGVESVRTRIAEGDAAHMIVELARREHADAIIMGTRGLSDLRGMMVGSVAHKVCHLAGCTVITVR